MVYAYIHVCVLYDVTIRRIMREKNMKNYWYEFNVANACRNVIIFEAGDVYYFSRN